MALRISLSVFNSAIAFRCHLRIVREVSKRIDRKFGCASFMPQIGWCNVADRVPRIKNTCRLSMLQISVAALTVMPARRAERIESMEATLDKWRSTSPSSKRPAGNTQTDQDSNWHANANYQFYDTQGSCYQSGLTAINGALATSTNGNGCPNGQNAVQWFAHPDGSPDGLGWIH